MLIEAYDLRFPPAEDPRLDCECRVDVAPGVACELPPDATASGVFGLVAAAIGDSGLTGAEAVVTGVTDGIAAVDVTTGG